MSKHILLLFFVALLPATHVLAQEDSAQANNPIANMVAMSLHDYYIGEFTGINEDGNQFWLRYAQPFSIGETNWLMRASLPVNTYPFESDGSSETGLGDVNVLASYLFDVGSPGISFGLGPQINAPSATDEILGSEQWSAGLANVLFDARSTVFQKGYLLTYAASFAGSSNRDAVNLLAFQPFLFYQLGGGAYLRNSGTLAFNFDNGDYTIPMGLGIGQVFPTEKTVYNVFVEPQLSLADDGALWPEWQIFVGFNMQFKLGRG